MNLLLPDSGLLFWMTIIFVIVFLILAKFGFPMITGMVEKRTKRIDDAIKAAREAESRLNGLAAEQEVMIARARQEHDRILKDAADQRDSMLASAREQAKEEAVKILEEARQKIDGQREAAMREVRREVAALVIDVAEKVVRKELSSDKDQAELVDRLIAEFEK